MKTKLKTAIIAISAFLYIADSYAVDYYSGKTTVSGNNVTYNIEPTFSDAIFLMNANDVYSSQTTPGMVGIETVDHNQMYQAIHETFTEQELESLKASDEKISIYSTLDANGNTIEVGYIFSPTPKMLAIPPDKFHLLEQKLIEYEKHYFAEGSDPVPFAHGMLFLHFRKVPPHPSPYVPTQEH